MINKSIKENGSVGTDFEMPGLKSSEPKNGIFRRIGRKILSIKKIGPKKLSIIILIIIAVAGSYGTVYYYKKYQAKNIDVKAEADKETKRLLEALGKLIELPQEETPTVATITDREKLEGQDFFAQAENGDVLFAYTTSMKAILYRPSINKIINVAPISINESQEVTQAVKKTTSTPTSTTKARE